MVTLEVIQRFEYRSLLYPAYETRMDLISLNDDETNEDTDNIEDIYIK